MDDRRSRSSSSRSAPVVLMAAGPLLPAGSLFLNAGPRRLRAVSGLDVAAGVAVFVAAALQSAVGFGFGLVCAPLLFAAFGPQQAVGLLMVVGLEVNLLTLLGEGRRPVPLWGLVGVVVAWSLPGMLVGVAVLRNVDAVVLQVALTAAVLMSLLVRWRAPARPH